MPRKIEVQIVGDSRSLERAFLRSDKAGRRFGSSVGQTSRKLARNMALVGGAVAGLGVLSSKGFAQFEESMDRVVGLAGGAASKVAQFSERILKIAPNVGKGPQELGEALYFVASAGVQASKQMGVVIASAKASAAGLGETATVADAVTSAMNAYGAGVVGAARATDVLVATVREGKGEASAFAPVIGTVAAIAAQLGVRFEEIGAALAAQTRLGIGAETAAVNLQAVFSSLLKETPKTAKALKGVGLSHALLRKELKEKGLLSLLQTLKTRFGDNTAAMAKAFPNIRALRALLALVGKNADQVRGVFERMADSTGALDLAFKAVSKGEAFKFKQTMAALSVVGIRLGAIFAPVAKKLADGATRALSVIGDFLGKLKEAKTVRAKINVIWRGATEAATGARDILTKAISSIDFDEIWKGASGIADGLQERLEEVDWGFLGTEIGDGIAGAVKKAIPAAKELGERITRAFRTIDFEALGRSLGPGLATAIVTAFVTLTDPAFWIRNWDLALAVGITAFGGVLGRLAKFLVKPLAGVAANIVGILGNLLVKGLTGIPRFLAKPLVLIVQFVGRQLGRLAGVVRERFAKLNKLAQFTLKVLGVLAVINVVVGFAKKVGRVFSNLKDTIRNLWDRVWTALKIRAVKAALEIIEPFTHIPGFLGGGAFQDLKSQWQDSLAAMEADTVRSVSVIQRSINSLEGKTVKVTIDTSYFVPQPSPATSGPPTGRAIPRPDDGGKDVEDAVVEKERADARRERAVAAAVAAKKRAAAAAAKAATAAKKAAENQQAAYARLIDALSLKLDIAGTTRKLDDDIRVQNVIIEAIKKQIGIEGRTTDLLRELFTARQNRAALERSERDLERSKRDSAQFKALGLSSTGEAKVPGLKGLRRQFNQVGEAIKGTFLDTSKTASLMKRIRRLLSGELGKLSAEVRGKVKQLLDDLANDLKGGTGQKGPKTKFRVVNTDQVLAGLGLSEDALKTARQRLARLGPGGTTPRQTRTGGAFGFEAAAPVSGGGGYTVIHNVTVTNPKDFDEFMREVEKRKMRRSGTRSGVRPGPGGRG